MVAAELARGHYDSETRSSNHAWESAQWRAQEVLRADLYVKYSGDTQLVAPTASYNFDTQRQYCKAAQDAVDS